jgi:transcriptional regulator with GAF, ATPase, and Fis domain
MSPPQDDAERVAELASLYEAARALIGARDRAQVAARLVLSGMGTLGVRSGAMFVADERGRYQLSYATGIEAPPRLESFTLPNAAREWMLREGVFAIASPATARALGALRDRLAEEVDAATGVAVSDPQGLLALIVFGPRLIESDGHREERTLLDAFASLGAQALAARPAASRVRRAPAARRAKPSLQALRDAHPALATMVGESDALHAAMQDLVSVAATPYPVLLAGESGVGKELAARAIHELSDRRDGPFEVLDCGSIPPELIESELFGHVRGSFTGAHRDRRGAFEMAQRGTLFLDEIGDMPLQLQTRLLRVLQESRFRRVGDERQIEADVRVVAATHRDLRREVESRRFREDLFYRLNVFAIRLPALRERQGDLVPLLSHFLRKQGLALQVPEWHLDPAVMEALESHAFPGNVRELANLCAALTVRTRGTGHITIEDLDHVWRRQHGGEEPPWRNAARGQLGEWVLEQARASRFNLVEATRALQRRRRRGQAVPLAERSALSYYLTGEILEALVAANGDPEKAARAIAGDDDLVDRVAPRVRKVCEALEAAGGRAGLQRVFGKLPGGYDEALTRAHALATHHPSR